MLFTGIYKHTIDSKLRLAIPSDIRDRLDAQRDGSGLYVCIGEDQTLCIYTEIGFELRAEQLDEADIDPDELLAYERAFYSLARRVEIDKQGRVRLPELLLQIADPGTNVVLVGVKDHLEIHNRQQWDDEQTKLLTNINQVLRNPRKIIRKKRSAENG